MYLKLLLLFLAIPFVELALLLFLADRTSWWFTLALVILTSVTGAWLIRSQGWRVWTRIRSELAAGQVPTDSLLDAALIFVAGALLITPGVLTDLVAIFLLIPPTRRFARQRLLAWLRARFQLHTVAYRESSAEPKRSEVINVQVIEGAARDSERRH